MTRRVGSLVAILGLLVVSTVAYSFGTRRATAPSMADLARLGGPVYVVPIEPVTGQSLDAFSEMLARHLPIPVQRRDEWRLDPRGMLSWDGDLYDVDELIDRLVAAAPPGTRLIGLTDQPMHDEEHWWLYGKGGKAAVVSTAHLWRDEWSAERDTADPLFRSRLAKVGVHEIGHCVGFWHCDDPRCVMYFSTELWMLDNSGVEMCTGCLRGWLAWN